jgi:hypothetical protein
MFCRPACRQRAYEARMKSRASSTAARPTASRIVPLVVSNRKEPFCTPEDVETFFPGKIYERPDLERIAEELNLIADRCINISRQASAPSAGKRYKLLQSFGDNAGRFLAHFGLDKPLDHLDSNRTISALNTLLLNVPANDPSSLYLLERMAKEFNAPELPSKFHAYRAALRGVQLLMHDAQLGADATRKAMGAKRRAPPEEIYLVAALRSLYHSETGDDDWYTASLDTGIPSGRLVNFVGLIARRIHDHRDAVEPAMPPALVKNLETLSRSPRRIGKRMQEVRRLLKGTNELKLPKASAV